MTKNVNISQDQTPIENNKVHQYNERFINVYPTDKFIIDLFVSMQDEIRIKLMHPTYDTKKTIIKNYIKQTQTVFKHVDYEICFE